MVIEQASLMRGLVRRFDFADADLGFTQIANGTGSSISYRISYTEIPHDSTTITIPNRRVTRAVFFTGLLIAVVTWAPAQTMPALGWAVSIAWVASTLVAQRLAAIELIQFTTKMGPLQILRDKKTSDLLREIDSRRNRAFLSQYDKLDAMAPRTRAALLWLQQQGHITDRDFRVRLATLDRFNPDLPPSPSEIRTLN